MVVWIAGAGRVKKSDWTFHNLVFYTSRQYIARTKLWGKPKVQAIFRKPTGSGNNANF